MPLDWTAFVELIKSYDSFLLTSHIRPDCDALGSELGMAGLLEALGKTVRIVNGHETPPSLEFIDPTRRIEVIDKNVRLDQLVDFGVLMILDTSAWAQLGPMGDVVRATNARKIIFDHHVGEDDLQAELFKDTSSPATGCLVVEAAERLAVELTPEIATPLFAAVATDTGWYRYPSVSAATYRAAAKLVDAGANQAAIYADLYERDTPGRVRLRGLILSRLQTELNGRLVYTYVLKEDFESTGAVPSDTEDVINMTLAIDGTEAAVILVEQLTGGCKLSFRSRCDMDCSQVAAELGGGGHKAAAGAFVNEPFATAKSKVLEKVVAAMK